VKDTTMTARLDDRLRELGDAVALHEPPPAVDRAVATAIEGSARRGARVPRSERASERWVAWPIALAASIFAISFIVRQAPPQDPVPVASADALREVSREFLAVAPVDEIARAGDAYVLPARLPRMALSQLGLPVDPQRVGEAVDTELLVRPDGAVLALRFVH
jgi:hypothetical protein